MQTRESPTGINVLSYTFTNQNRITLLSQFEKLQCGSDTQNRFRCVGGNCSALGKNQLSPASICFNRPSIIRYFENDCAKQTTTCCSIDSEPYWLKLCDRILPNTWQNTCVF